MTDGQLQSLLAGAVEAAQAAAEPIRRYFCAADIGLQATFHSTMLWARPATPEEMGVAATEPELALAGD